MVHITGVMLSRYSRIACRCLMQVLDGPGFSSATAWDHEKGPREHGKSAYIVCLLEPTVTQTCCPMSPHVGCRCSE